MLVPQIHKLFLIKTLPSFSFFSPLLLLKQLLRSSYPHCSLLQWTSLYSCFTPNLNSFSFLFTDQYAFFMEANPLFSSIVTLYILILLYFPSLFLYIIFSPVFVSTGILLAYLLRLGAIQTTKKSAESFEEQQAHVPDEDDYIWDSYDFNSETNFGFGHDGYSFFKWNLKAPLEIIYEAYEGEEEGEEEDREKHENRAVGIESYPSLSFYYPESDTDSSSDCEFAVVGSWDSPENLSFRWEEEGEGLIEIALDGKRRSQFFNGEEDNLIEIDISPPGRNDKFSGEC